MRVAIGGEHLEHAVVDGEKRDIERATAKIEDKYVAFT